MNIKQEISRGLTPDELQSLYNKYSNSYGHLPVITYDQIMNASNIDNLFSSSNCIVIFYPLNENQTFGHYTALIRHVPNKIYFFDPYGYKIDDIKRFSANKGSKNRYPNEKNNSLVKLLLNSNYDIDFSHHKLQSKKSSVATCGRWCVLRCIKEELTNDEFNNYIKRLIKESGIKDKDLLVTSLIH